MIGACAEGADGAWVVTLARITVIQGGHIRLRWQLEHVHGSARAAIAPTEQGDDADERDDNVQVDGERISAEPDDWTGVNVRFMDLDSDGAPEAFVMVRGQHDKAPPFSRGRVFTFRSGHIEPYGPLAGVIVQDIRDLDGDGRLDATSFGPFDIVADHCDSGIGFRETGPELPLHGLPGGAFAWDDAMTRAALKDVCPARPSTFVLPPGVLPENPDRPLSAGHRVACARLWGANTEWIEAQLARECPPRPGRPCEAQSCRDADYLHDFAKATPPVVVR
ncbi:hypothetical protein [Polyangium sp. y55x31]|uniref:hypothetical protein n=1 Tax=Polyangium sp. y55x31 TaxID=3042688 RepID=UPI0024826140|nr:hypothetical protein [Polyangium sp. y55x31]MDI1479251.1 hypothetical protein [Polyangium sp. y55x31]